ncbi:MAG: response regulator [Bdellovibrionaceae bacterium]|nr:response regulator [Pseudobdellovibrionaceae bacterium]
MSEQINILLVDDRPEGIVTLEAVLTNPEYNLVKANSGKEALAKVLAHDFAVILMDVQMPEMDGFETVSLIKQRERSRNIPIIFLTALTTGDHNISRGYSVGAVDYVFKPFDAYILKSKVAVFVDLFKKNLLLKEQAEALQEAERRERLRTLNELELEGRRRYQNLADAIPQIVFRAGRDGAMEYFNQFWHLYTAKTLKESAGNGWESVVHPKDMASVDEKWTESFRSQTGFECECRFRHGKTGEYRWHLLRVVPEFNELTDLVCWIGAATDIHDQKMIQQELMHAKKMADAASETKSRFLANMSHEIRTPLGVILGFSELLGNPKTTPAQRDDSIAVIRRNGEQLSKIIDEILDLSKVEAGKLDIELGDISTVDFLNGVHTFMSLSAREKGLELLFDVKGEVPKRVHSNASRLQQILVNLIGNAIKFSPKGAIRVTVSHQAAEKGRPSRLAISVKDSGPGLTNDQIQNLFQPFTQVDTSMTRKYGGTGLGLALSRRLARALGGDIVVEESPPGEGCEFVITLETGDLTDVPFTSSLQVDSRKDETAKSKNRDTLKGVKVLLVEDSVDNQVLVSRFLTMEGAQVELANNGLEGVEKAIGGDHDVVLMDIQMPVLDGYGAISKLRGQGFEKPIIALTAHGMVEDRKRCLEYGSNDHLTKPVNRVALIDRVYQFSQQARH